MNEKFRKVRKKSVETMKRFLKKIVLLKHIEKKKTFWKFGKEKFETFETENFSET